MNLDAALQFAQFTEARHETFLRRQAGESWPWTDDPIVQTRKFTNVYRVLDWGSQFVLTDLLDPEVTDVDILMRLFLYRHTGRVEVWKYLREQLGYYPVLEDLEMVRAVFKEYRGDAHVRTRTADPRNAGRKTQTDFKRSVFTSAYLVFPQSQVPGTDKLDSIIDLTKRLFVEQRTGIDFLGASSQAERFETLRRNKGVAEFMSMQILTDWGYTTEFREDDFVIAGPGARKGAAALGMKPEEAIRWAHQTIRHLELGGRVPSWMDAQNCLCEFSKYVRYASQPTPTKGYSPAHPGAINFVLPKHW